MQIRRASGGLALLVLTVALVGCGKAAIPTPTPISDAREVIARSLDDLRTAPGFHVSGTISGSVDMGSVSKLVGAQLGLSGNLDLKGGTLTGDVDPGRRAAHLTIAFPSLFGFSLDAIEVDGFTYTRVNLTSDKYSRTATDIAGLQSAAASALPGWSGAPTVAAVAGLLDSAGATATLAGQAAVDGRDTYRVDLAISPDRIGSAVRSFAPGLADITVDSASVRYWVYADTLLPAQVEVSGGSASLGTLDVVATFTKYGQAVAIAAPSADQIAEP